jgi:hypothetical protein
MIPTTASVSDSSVVSFGWGTWTSSHGISSCVTGRRPCANSSRTRAPRRMRLATDAPGAAPDRPRPDGMATPEQRMDAMAGCTGILCGTLTISTATPPRKRPGPPASASSRR